MKFILPVLLVFSVVARAETCSWCIDQDAAVKKDVIALAKKSPADILKTIQAKGVCIKILAAGRKVPPNTFYWGQIQKPEGKMELLSKTPNLMGKTLCADELPLAKGCTTIFLADDAPKSTLIHEYLHTQQIARGKDWCEISKRAWTQKQLSPLERKRQLDAEWDVHRWLFENVDELNLSTEDKVGIAGNLSEQAELRKNLDPEALPYVQKNHVNERLMGWIEDYKKALGLKN